MQSSFFFFFSSCFQVPGGSFPCLQKVCCKSEAHIRKGLSNRINKQVGLTSSCEPWVSVFSEAGGPFSYPRVSLSPPSFIALPSSWQRWRLCFRPHSWATTQVFFFFSLHWPHGVRQQPAHISALQLWDMHVSLKQCWHMTSTVG